MKEYSHKFPQGKKRTFAKDQECKDGDPFVMVEGTLYSLDRERERQHCTRWGGEVGEATWCSELGIHVNV